MSRWPILLLALAGRLLGQDLPLGVVVDRVPCGGGPLSYALYLPSHYTATRLWPILYCLDPGAQGRLPVERFARAAETEGYIVVGSNDSRNGPSEPVREAVLATLEDTHLRFAIDDTRIYVAGFSGGARIALGWVAGAKLAGAVACGAAFGPSGPPKNLPYQLFLAAGTDDFNYHEVHAASVDLARHGVKHLWVEFEGGHQWLPEPLALEALQFFDGKAPAQAAVESGQEEKEAQSYQRYLDRLMSPEDSGRQALAARLRKEAHEASDGPNRRVARRALGGAYISSDARGQQLMEDKRYDQAAAMYETATLARPDAPQGWYVLGVARAATGRRAKALEALEQAVANGFRDWQRMEAEPLLAPLRSDSRYQALARIMGR